MACNMAIELSRPELLLKRMNMKCIALTSIDALKANLGKTHLLPSYLSQSACSSRCQRSETARLYPSIETAICKNPSG